MKEGWSKPYFGYSYKGIRCGYLGLDDRGTYVRADINVKVRGSSCGGPLTSRVFRASARTPDPLAAAKRWLERTTKGM